jgi:esterase
MKLKYSIQGAGEPIILLHGMFGSGSNLGLLNRFLSNEYLVVTPDLRNHGQSPSSQEMNYPCMAKDIIELMDSLNIYRATMIGHSMGGKIAMQVALNNAARVSNLVVVDVSPVNYDPDRHSKVIEGLNALVKAKPISRKEADNLLSVYVEDLSIRGFLLKNLVHGADGKLVFQLFMKSISANYHSRLILAPTGEPFTGPSLFIKGGNSPYIQDEHLGEISRLFPEAQHACINNSGHWVHAEKPTEFNQITIDFLRTQSNKK